MKQITNDQNEKWFLCVVVREEPCGSVEEAFGAVQEGEPRTELKVTYFKSGWNEQMHAATFCSNFIKDGGSNIAYAILVQNDQDEKWASCSELSPWFGHGTGRDLRPAFAGSIETAGHGWCTLYVGHAYFGRNARSLQTVAQMLCLSEGHAKGQILPSFLTK